MAKDPWPLDTPQPIAWGMEDNMTASAVPLYPKDLETGLSLTAYLERLADRVAWMLEREDDWQEATASLAVALEQVDGWEGPRDFDSPHQAASAMLDGNPAFLDLLGSCVSFPEERPMKVSRMPRAVYGIKNTSLFEWLDMALPAKRGLD